MLQQEHIYAVFSKLKSLQVLQKACIKIVAVLFTLLYFFLINTLSSFAGK